MTSPVVPPRANRSATSGLFAGLPAELRADLLASGRRLTLQSGQFLFRQGEPGDEVFLVESGHVEVIGQTDEGETVLAILGTGQLVGEVALCAPGPRTAAVRAVGETQLWGLTRAAYDAQLAAGAPAAVMLAQRMAELLAARLRATAALMQETVLAADDAFESGYYVPVPISELTESLGLPVRVASELRTGDLQDLIDGRILALRVPGYVNRRLCEHLCRRLLRHPGFARYLLAPEFGLQRIGMTLFETQNQPELLDTYYREARSTMLSIRRICAPMLTPMDRFRLELEELWPSGAHIERMHGRKMLVGIARMFEDAHALEPHQDIIRRDLPDSDDAQRIRTQITANVYLRLPKVGGELELWEAQPDDAEAQRLYTGTHDFYDRAKLPPPTAVLQPSQGEMLLWLTDRVHAVRACTGGPRVSASCFVGFRGHGEPLTMWS
ncbi:MAG: cyclic nucleotide-binding domain-containing protein [Deltaproteobacteria bacterium]|nr:cyclic nucleotide-binding domain-containing protein [Deltaproteobacteria bacterium]